MLRETYALFNIYSEQRKPSSMQISRHCKVIGGLVKRNGTKVCQRRGIRLSSHVACSASGVRGSGGTAGGSGASFGIFVVSGAPGIAEPLCHTGVDWICIGM